MWGLALRSGVDLRSHACAVGHVTSVSGGQPQGKPGGKGDPILTGFDLRPFEFMGQPGKTYNLISEQRHQVRDIGQTAFSSALQPAMTSVKGPSWQHA